MSKGWRILVTAVPVLLIVCLYGANLARIYNSSIWFLWLQAAFFAVLCLFVIATAMIFIVTRIRRRSLAPAFIVGFAGLLGSFPIGRFVLDKQDEQFMRKLPHYQKAIEWIEQHGGITPAQDQFRHLAPLIIVQKSPIRGCEVFFVAYPGPFGARLHGYAYTSADKWNEHFARVYPPKKLTNNWYRI